MHDLVIVYRWKVDKELNPSELLDRVVCTCEDSVLHHQNLELDPPPPDPRRRQSAARSASGSSSTVSSSAHAGVAEMR
jgi:hypothetical protein